MPDTEFNWMTILHNLKSFGAYSLIQVVFQGLRICGIVGKDKASKLKIIACYNHVSFDYV